MTGLFTLFALILRFPGKHIWLLIMQLVFIFKLFEFRTLIYMFKVQNSHLVVWFVVYSC